MGQVVQFTEQRTRRDDRERDRSMHPSLRWVAGDTFYIAHRKDDAHAACGAAGDLTLAPPGVPRCCECFPVDCR